MKLSNSLQEPSRLSSVLAKHVAVQNSILRISVFTVSPAQTFIVANALPEAGFTKTRTLNN